MRSEGGLLRRLSQFCKSRNNGDRHTNWYSRRSLFSPRFLIATSWVVGLANIVSFLNLLPFPRYLNQPKKHKSARNGRYKREERGRRPGTYREGPLVANYLVAFERTDSLVLATSSMLGLYVSGRSMVEGWILTRLETAILNIRSYMYLSHHASINQIPFQPLATPRALHDVRLD
jgi:hypothetical protein